jgi:hypothetical protein
MDAGGIAVPLFIAFLVLKLTGNTSIAHWSWWWIFSPLWIDAAVTAILFAVFAFVGISVFGAIKRLIS